jgi:hypothetical protein
VRSTRRLAAAGLTAVLLCASAARPQDGPFGGLQPHYWPRRTVGIPVEPDSIANLSPKPTHLQLYSSFNRGPFQKGPRLPIDKLTELNGGKRGFEFEAPRDGDYEFAVQLVDPDGSVSPKTDALAPAIRAIVDTVPPRVQLAPLGNGVEWVATDDNLDPRYVTLECKWPAGAEWTKITDRPLRAADSYGWKLKPGQVLEVRVIAKDRAGNEGVSPVVRVPGEPGTAVGLPRDRGPWPGGGAGAAALPQPRIDYVSTLDFDVDYTVQRMGRSGVKAAHLFVLKEQGGWELVKQFEVKMKPDDKPPLALSLPYSATREGTYGFFIIPESGAGKRADDPKRDDQPMVLVVVDTKKPDVKITGVQVRAGPRGPQVDITWLADDANLMPQPVSLEWSVDQSKWSEIKYRLDNNVSRTTGRYTWEVPDDKLWKFWVRARAVDKASNVGEAKWDQEVIVDLTQPSATIDRIRGGGTGGPKPKERPKPAGGGGSDGPPAALPDH